MHVLNRLDETLLDGLAQRVPADHIREILVPDVARTRDTEDVPEAVLGIEQELLPFPGSLPGLVGHMVGLVVQDGHAHAFADQAVADRRFNVLQDRVVVFHADGSVYDSF